MTPEEELATYKEELKALEAGDLRHARSTATKFGIIAVISLIALVYAFFQQTQANKGRELAEQNKLRARETVAAAEQSLKNCQADVEAARIELSNCQKP